jgi:hypothetical protein
VLSKPGRPAILAAMPGNFIILSSGVKSLVFENSVASCDVKKSSPKRFTHRQLVSPHRALLAMKSMSLTLSNETTRPNQVSAHLAANHRSARPGCHTVVLLLNRVDPSSLASEITIYPRS